MRVKPYINGLTCASHDEAMDHMKLVSPNWKDMVGDEGWRKMAREEMPKVQAPVITAVVFSHQRVIMDSAKDIKFGHEYLRFPRFKHNLQDIRLSKNRLVNDGIQFFKYAEIETKTGHLIVIKVGDDDLLHVKDFLGSGGKPFPIDDVRKLLNRNGGEIAISAQEIIQEHRLF